MTRAETETMTYDHWKSTEPDEWAEHVCEQCKRRAADAYDEARDRWLCADCAFDEACREDVEGVNPDGK